MAKIIETKQFKGTCIICNCAPQDETQESRPPLAMFHAVGVNVNYNEDCNICQICAGVMADLLGREDDATFLRLSKELEALKEAHTTLNEEHEQLTNRVERLIEGKKAVKEIKDAAADKPKAKKKVTA